MASDPADLGVQEASAALASRALSARELDRRMSRAHRASETASTATTVIRRPSTPGSASTRKTQGRPRPAPTSGSRRGDAPVTVRHPDRAEGSLRRRRKAADRVEPRPGRGSRHATATSGCGSPPRGWCCSGTCTRTSSPAVGRPTRSATRGRSSDRRADPVEGRPQRSRRSRCLRPRAPTRPARCAFPRPSAGRRRSSRRAGSSPCAGSCRLHGRSTTPGRWRGPSRDSELLLGSDGGRGRAGRAAAPPLRRVAAHRPVLEPDVADGFDRALAALPGRACRAAASPARLDVLAEFFDLVLTEMLVYHRRFDDRRDGYRPSNRARLEHAEQRAMTAEEYIGGQARRAGGHGTRGATGSPSIGSTRSSSRRCRSSHPCAGTATTRRSATSTTSR